MIDMSFIDEISRRISHAVPPGAHAVRQEIEKNARAILHASFDKLELVTREEFDLQAKVLEHTRSRLRELEQQVADLERRLGNPRT